MHTEQELAARLKKIQAKPFGWAAVLLRTTMSDSAKTSVLQKESTRYALKEMAEREGMEAYFCRDGDVFFLFQGEHKERLEVITTYLYRFFPQVNPKDVAFDEQAELYPLADRFERVMWLTNQKVEAFKEAQKQEAALAGAVKERPTYVTKLTWSAEKFRIAQQERALREQKLIFIVDDDDLLRDVAVTILMQKYRVQIADDAHSALSYYNRHAPDLVFLDIGLPDESGLKLLHLIKEHDPIANVVMFSGYKKDQMVKTALKIGAKGYLVKPFQPKDLLKYAEIFINA